jgi:hypothetical protein
MQTSRQPFRLGDTLRRSLTSSLLALCLLFGYPQFARSVEYEQPGEFSAETILKPEQLSGPYHTVDDRVQYDGLFYRYTVNSPYGTFQANSTVALNILINELGAIAVMKTVSTEDTAVKSIEQSGVKTVTGIKNLFTSPESTLEGAAQGVGDLFNRTRETVGRRETTETEDSKFAQVVGFTKSKGQIATKFGVSIYSRNQVLQGELDRLGMADYLGGISVGLATSVIPGVGGLVLTTSGTARLLDEVINNTPPSKLWVQNKNKLLGMGFDADTVELFLNNPVFSPALETVLVSALDSMKGAANRGIFIKIGMQASNPDMAGFITEIAVLSAGYHKNVAPLKSFAPMARLASGIKKDGTTVILLSTDHLIWSERIANVVEGLTAAKQGRGARFELWTLGTLSNQARSALQEKGWKTYENALGKLIPIQQ